MNHLPDAPLGPEPLLKPCEFAILVFVLFVISVAVAASFYVWWVPLARILLFHS